MFKIIRELDKRPDFSIFTPRINGKTLTEMFKNAYCSYYMEPFVQNIKGKDNPFLKAIKKNSCFTGDTFHVPIEVLSGKEKSA